MAMLAPTAAQMHIKKQQQQWNCSIFLKSQQEQQEQRQQQQYCQPQCGRGSSCLSVNAATVPQSTHLPC
ncbi:hypothetical protein AWZ03_009659 [Drosophila navojoa]|uniref:Uncharacterized protein n=1 Tax=Drosophila navojoa TaxID=7232 RepID=A0A484B7Y3_DRONA|nr:hypothetical protein AWZ03_009659 [Drosophila navojoa]